VCVPETPCGLRPTYEAANQAHTINPFHGLEWGRTPKLSVLGAGPLPALGLILEAELAGQFGCASPLFRSEDVGDVHPRYVASGQVARKKRGAKQ